MGLMQLLITYRRKNEETEKRDKRKIKVSVSLWGGKITDFMARFV